MARLHSATVKAVAKAGGQGLRARTRRVRAKSEGPAPLAPNDPEFLSQRGGQRDALPHWLRHAHVSHALDRGHHQDEARSAARIEGDPALWDQADAKAVDIARRRQKKGALPAMATAHCSLRLVQIDSDEGWKSEVKSHSSGV